MFDFMFPAGHTVRAFLARDLMFEMARRSTLYVHIYINNS